MHEEEIEEETPTESPATAADLEQLGYKEDFQYMWVCGRCFDLCEEGRPDGLEQRCRCQDRDEKLWPRYDFNERACLCLCCGFEVLESGSRWSPYFCRECGLLARGVSVWQRSLVFPIGRHSLMHMWVPNAPSASLTELGGDSEQLDENVSNALQSVSKGSQGLLQWYEIKMRTNFAELDLRGNVTLVDYLRAVHRERLAFLSPRLVAFHGLCEFFKTK